MHDHFCLHCSSDVGFAGANDAACPHQCWETAAEHRNQNLSAIAGKYIPVKNIKRWVHSFSHYSREQVIFTDVN